MAEWRLKTPVGLIIFNRPETTARVLAAIRQVRPPKLFVSADGPRPNRPGEAEKCAATRAVIASVDWECEVFTNYSDANLGCGLGEASGFSWVFEHVPEAIFLEDDTLPHPSFFRFCEELLARYRDDERVMHISGTNLSLAECAGQASYRFSRYPFCWGWASWRRAWRFYDLQIQRLPEIVADGWLAKLWPDKRTADFWLRHFASVHNQPHPHTWDYQWILAIWLQHGLSIIPKTNLVTNIGFGNDATHTLGLPGALRALNARHPWLRYGKLPELYSWLSQTALLGETFRRLDGSRYSNVALGEMDFPLQHPPFVVRDAEADELLQRNNYEGGKLGSLKRILREKLLG